MSIRSIWLPALERVKKGDVVDGGDRWFEEDVRSTPTEPNDTFKLIVELRLAAEEASAKAATVRWVADIEKHRGTAGKLGFGWNESLSLCVGSLLWTMPIDDLLTGGSESGEPNGISLRYLVNNSLWALHARESYPWAKAVPWMDFLRSVVPYAVVCEGRGEWREAFHAATERCWGSDGHLRQLQAAEGSVDSVVHRLVTLIRTHITGSFGQPGVVSVTDGFLAPFQSPYETLDYGSGRPGSMQLFMIYALRAAGIPCRLVVETSITNADDVLKGNSGARRCLTASCCSAANPQFYSIDAQRPFKRSRGGDSLPEGVQRTECGVVKARCQYSVPSGQWFDFEATGHVDTLSAVQSIDFAA